MVMTKGNWLERNIVEYLYENISYANTSMEVMTEDIVEMVKEADDNGTLAEILKR